MTQAPRLLVGRYEIGELIGRGGMADVHAGYDARLGRDVAIKILRSELARDPSFLMRFRREAQAAASLNHPCIVAVFDSGEDALAEDGLTEGAGVDPALPFIVMEHVHGHTLRDILHEDGGPLEPMRAARIMVQVLRALQYSHEHGIVHRDIKPANVMLAEGDVAKVMDFGIARAVADTAATMTNTSIVVGTAQYLSPEQAQGRDVDARSDLYSAGCLLYELLTGRPPFVGDSPVAIAYQHVGEPPQPPSVHAAEVPSDLDVVVLHALAKEPDDRYATGGDFAADLDAVMRREPTKAAAAAVAAGELAPAPLPDPGPATGATVLEHPPSRPRRRLLVPLLLALLAALAVVLVVLQSRGVFDSTAPVTVPNVVGQNQQQATATLTDAQLTPTIRSVADQRPAGTVIAQDPAGGDSRAAQSPVQLTVSSGPGEVVVPNLRNYQQETAAQALRDNNLTVGGVRQVDSYEVTQGSVVGTAPKAGSQVTQGTPVTLIISTGRVAVPEVVGMTQEDATAALNRFGLRTQPNYVEGTRAPGTVTGQSYPEGTKVPVGTEVTLTVVRSRPSTSTVTVTTSPPTTDSPSPTTTPSPSPTSAPDPEPTSSPPSPPVTTPAPPTPTTSPTE